ncbi:MAG: serine hydrolase domain-containing protein [Actinomycetota bacterium]
MTSRIIAVVAMAIVGALAWLAPSSRAARTPASYSSIVPGLMRTYRTPSVAVAVITNRSISFEQGFGSATPHTAFGAGSISKTASAFGVLTLVQSGRIKLDDPAQRYLRRWHFPPSRFDASSITIRELLSHTAGTSIDGYLGATDPRNVPTLVDSLNGSTRQPVRIVRKPGSKFVYSSGGYAVLQLMIEDVTHRSFADYMHDAVLAPLGLNDSSYTLTARERSHLAAPYHSTGHREALHYLAEEAPDGLYTSAHDLARLFIALTGSNPVLDQSIRSQMTTPQPATTHADPLASKSWYGLGIEIERVGKSQIVEWHPGVVPGYAAIAATLADGSSGIVVLTNADPGIHVAESLLCDWSRRATGSELGVCTSTSRLEKTAVVVAQSTTAGLVVAALAILIGIATRKRRTRAGGRRFFWGTLSGVPLIVIGGAWWFFWFTNTLTAKVWHEDITPVALAPSSLRIWSYPLIALCGVIALAIMITEHTVRPRRITSSAAQVAIAAGWIFAWQTDLLTRLVLGTTGIVPFLEIASPFRYIPAALGVIAVIIVLVRARNPNRSARSSRTELAEVFEEPGIRLRDATRVGDDDPL